MRVLRALRDELASFLAGQEHGACVLRGAPEHLPFVYRLLQELEDASTDVFLGFPHRFDSAEAYAELVAGRIEASGREARGAARGSLPERCRDRRRAVAERLKEVLGCARELLPRGADRPRLVVVLCPLEVADTAEYAALIRAMIEPGSASPPWFRQMRLLVHTPADEARPLPRFVRALKVDLSAEAMAESAASEAEDPSLSRSERAEALLRAAMLDVGPRRFERAKQRLDALYGEAQALQSSVLAALALSGLGDVERLEGRRDAAIGWYERALVPASEAGAPLVLLMITRHLAELYAAGGRLADAEVFFDGAQRLAGVIPEPETQATSLIGRGLAQQRLGAPPATWAASFLAAAEVARDNARAELLATLRPRLEASRSHKLPTELRRSIDELLGGGA